jgi:anthranilate synthase component I
VDLNRNDLGRVAKYGSVRVKDLMRIKKFSHVQHIESVICGQIDRNEDMFSALAASFPAGVLSGAPKIEAMKIIDRLESGPRGPYGGGVGHFGFNGNCVFAGALRSVFISGESAFTQTSSGIVFDSDPEKEYEEIQNKLAATRRVLAQ